MMPRRPHQWNDPGWPIGPTGVGSDSKSDPVAGSRWRRIGRSSGPVSRLRDKPQIQPPDICPRGGTRKPIACGRPAHIISCDDGCGSASSASSDRPCGDPFLDDDWPCDLSRAIRRANLAGDESAKASSGIVSERNRLGGQTQGERSGDARSGVRPASRITGLKRLGHASRPPTTAPEQGSRTGSPAVRRPALRPPDKAAEPAPGRGARVLAGLPRPGRSPYL
jgi:hypothetical protein